MPPGEAATELPVALQGTTVGDSTVLLWCGSYELLRGLCLWLGYGSGHRRISYKFIYIQLKHIYLYLFATLQLVSTLIPKTSDCYSRIKRTYLLRTKKNIFYKIISPVSFVKISIIMITFTVTQF